MNEENKEKEQSNEPINSKDGDQPKREALSVIEAANIAAERLEKANKEKEKLIEREENIIARRRLGGDTAINQQIPKVESNKDYVNRIMSTGKV